MITRHMIAEKSTDYLQHRLSLHDLVQWAEEAMLEGDFDDNHFETIRDIISKLGLADVKDFGLPGMNMLIF